MKPFLQPIHSVEKTIASYGITRPGESAKKIGVGWHALRKQGA
jgi:hypothetical protein